MVRDQTGTVVLIVASFFVSQGIDTLRNSQTILPSHKSFIQAPQQYSQQYAMLTPQQQQQLLLQAQNQPSGSPLLQDMDHRRFRVLLGGRGGMSGKEGAHSNPGSDVTGGAVGSPGMQAASPVPRAAQDQELLMKVKIWPLKKILSDVCK
jgi:hypothetical protein